MGPLSLSGHSFCKAQACWHYTFLFFEAWETFWQDLTRGHALLASGAFLHVQSCDLPSSLCLVKLGGVSDHRHSIQCKCVLITHLQWDQTRCTSEPFLPQFSPAPGSYEGVFSTEQPSRKIEHHFRAQFTQSVLFNMFKSHCTLERWGNAFSCPFRSGWLKSCVSISCSWSRCLLLQVTCWSCLVLLLTMLDS